MIQYIDKIYIMLKYPTQHIDKIIHLIFLILMNLKKYKEINFVMNFHLKNLEIGCCLIFTNAKIYF